jgi:hypothetical protein
MAAFVKRRHSLFSRDHEHGLHTVLSVTPNGEREAWGMAATMDHSSIRGLGTALHLFLAGLPRSEIGDHPEGCSLKISEGSPHRSHASRSRLGVWLEVEVLSGAAPLVVLGFEKDLGFHFHVARYVPNKTGELSGDGDADFVLRQLSSHRQATPALGQTQLRLPRDVTDDFWMTFLANFELATDLCLEPIVPSGLHQDTSGVFVAAFGDSALTSARSTGELRRHHTQIRHQCARMSKAGQIAHLSDESHCGNEVKTFQAHQCLDHWVHAPIFALHSQRLSDPFDSFAGLFGRQTIFVEGKLLRRMLEADCRQVSIVRLGPVSFSLIMTSMAQHHRLHLQAHPMSGDAHIFSGANEIPNRFVAFIGDHDVRQIPGARLSRQQQRIASIGFEALLRRLSSNPGRSDDIARPTLLSQVPYPSVAAGSGLVHDQRSLLGAHSTHRLAQLSRRRVDRADKSRRSTIRIRNRYCNGFLMNIQPNIRSGRLFHGLSPDGFGSTIPSGTLHVARCIHVRNPRYRRQTTSKTFNMCRTPMRTCGHDV